MASKTPLRLATCYNNKRAYLIHCTVCTKQPHEAERWTLMCADWMDVIGLPGCPRRGYMVVAAQDLQYRICKKKNTHLIDIERGWGNGYVVLPKGHKYHGSEYDEIDVNVNGGLTFSESVDSLDWDELTEKDKGGWVIGFDTAHAWDNLELWPDAQSVMKECERLMKQL